jgi:hypothetical protein
VSIFLSKWAKMAAYTKWALSKDYNQFLNSHEVDASATPVQRAMYEALMYQTSIHGANIHAENYVGDVQWMHDIRKEDI